MSITVKDCLSLPSLSMGKVLGGHGGLNSIVNSVSVLEFDYTTEELYTPNELVITAFYVVKNDIDAQVEAIYASKRSGIVCIVLFYSEVVLQGIDQRLIDAANEINLPLLLLPGDNLGLKYSDVIRDVSEAVMLDAKSENTFVKDTLDRISQMSFQKRTMDNVLSLLSESNRCTVSICDRNDQLLWYSFWPKGNIFNIETELQAKTEGNSYHCNFHDKDGENLTLHFLRPYATLSHGRIVDSAEVLQLFSSIWNVSASATKRECIIASILEGKTALYTSEAKIFNIDLSQYHTLLFMKGSENNETVQSLLLQYDSSAISDLYKDSLVCLSELSTSDIKWSLFLDELNEKVGSKIFVISNTDIVPSARRYYLEYYKARDFVDLLYPSQSVVGYDILRFIARCRKLMNKKDTEGKYYYDLIASITESGDSFLLSTLRVYLFEASSSVNETSRILFIHRNTVKYRLDCIRKLLGRDFDCMPFYYDVYTAVAISQIENTIEK